MITFERTCVVPHLKIHNLTTTEYEAQHGAPVAISEESSSISLPAPVVGSAEPMQISHQHTSAQSEII